MKKFRVSIPAHITITIEAANRRTAIIQAKNKEGINIRGCMLGDKDAQVDVGKFVSGIDYIEEDTR